MCDDANIYIVRIFGAFLFFLAQPNAYFCENPKHTKGHLFSSHRGNERHNKQRDIHKTHTHTRTTTTTTKQQQALMSYKPHLQSLVDDLKSNPSLIHDPSFRALRALFASEFDAKFPQQKQEEKDDEKNNDAKNEEQQEREENDAVHIDDPDVVGPESEPVPEENTQDPNKQLTVEEANLVRF